MMRGKGPDIGVGDRNEEVAAFFNRSGNTSAALTLADETAQPSKVQRAGVWARLAKHLKRRGIEAWLRAKLKGYVEDALRDEQGFLFLCERASLELYLRRRKGAKRQAQRAGTALTFMDAREKKRAEVLGRELARLARKRGAAWKDGAQIVASQIQRFRNRMTGGKPLSRARAERFLMSPANALFCQGVVPHLPYPLADHSAKVTSLERINDPDGRTRRRYCVAIAWRGKTVQEPIEYPEDSERTKLHVQVDTAVQVYAYSVLGELAALANELAEHYFWEPADATWFVLTDEPPIVHPFTARSDHRGISDHTLWRIELTVHPWVSARSFARFYRHAQAQLQGRENRNPRIDSLEFLDVVAEARHRGASWSEAMRQWNAGRPKSQRYRLKDVRNFSRDFEARYRLVIRPDLRPYPSRPTVRDSPETKSGFAGHLR